MEIMSFFMAASAGEAWQAVPMISMHLPFFGIVLWWNVWAFCVVGAILLSSLSHSENHAYARAGDSAFSSLRKQIFFFWNTQILERVHLKWRTLSSRGVGPAASRTNRLSSAWVSLSQIQRKTSGIWVVVLFFVLLFSNSFGLVPLCAAVTGQRGTTLGLSIAVLTAVTVAGVQRQGIRFVKLFLPSGPSWPMAPLFVLLESISYSFRAVSLGVRLWANMFRGHLLMHLITALALVPALCLNVVIGAPITALAAGLLMALTGLETIVALLQSGVFCLLSSFYLHEVLSRRDPLAPAV
uniref:ATP synthase subunit a n=1 Tax=Rotundella rotunda TaxID=1357779 RepID=A0A076YLK8_9CHLO|nr:ATP synthase F0 subunit 6 [Rotundella rotunda]